MEKTNFNEYVAAVNNLKQRYKRIETNNAVMSEKFKEALEINSCWILQTQESVFLAVLERDAFYRLYYYATGNDGITSGLCLIDERYDKNKPLVCTVIGKEVYVESVVPAFYNEGFSLRRKTRRFNTFSGFNDDSVIRSENTTAEFARKDEAKEIETMLLNQFDVYSEQIPTVSEIEKNAEKEMIIVIRRDDKIAAVQYIEVHNNSILYGIFDYVRPEYRRDLLFFEFRPFLQNALREKGVRIKRVYGWRDMENKKLNKVSEKLGHIPEDVVLYTVINSFGKEV